LFAFSRKQANNIAN